MRGREIVYRNFRTAPEPRAGRALRFNPDTSTTNTDACMDVRSYPSSGSENEDGGGRRSAVTARPGVHVFPDGTRTRTVAGVGRR